MNRSVIIVFIVILVLGLLGYFGYRSAANNGNTANTNNSIAVPTQISEISQTNQDFNLDEQNESGQTGRVVLIDQDGKTRVTISLDNEPDQASQPAHIHTGQCPNPGAVKYPLNPVVDGRSDTILDVNYSTLTTQTPLAINVHKSATEIQSYVACGNLAF